MSIQDFLEGFGPSNLHLMAVNSERCHIGKGPTIKAATESYGMQALQQLTLAYVQNLHNYLGTPCRLTPEQVADIATIVYIKYPSLKVAEYCLYFLELKAGTYGKLFGQLYPQDITLPLPQYAEHCHKLQNRLLYERHQRELARWREEGYSVSD